MAEAPEAAWLHAHAELTIVELAEISGLEEPILRELVEYGALSPANPRTLVFSATCVTRVRTAARLRADLELDTQAVALALSLLERIESLQGELRALRARTAGARRGP
jgi:chaperone modulatory protein CbpM